MTCNIDCTQFDLAMELLIQNCFDGITDTIHTSLDSGFFSNKPDSRRAAVKIPERLQERKVAVQMSGGNASAVELRLAMKEQCLIDRVVD